MQMRPTTFETEVPMSIRSADDYDQPMQMRSTTIDFEVPMSMTSQCKCNTTTVHQQCSELRFAYGFVLVWLEFLVLRQLFYVPPASSLPSVSFLVTMLCLVSFLLFLL